MTSVLPLNPQSVPSTLEMSIHSSKPKNVEIQYLRGIAVSLAVLNHIATFLPWHGEFLLWFCNVIAMPGTGVDLFFCISGFIVSRAFLDFFQQHRDQGRFALSLQVFWIRRAFRLLPTAWLWVAVGIVCSIFFNQTKIFGTIFENVRSAAVVITASGNFAHPYGFILHPNEIYWSLALEEQFYLFFPFFMLLVPAFWRWRVLLLLIAAQFFVDRNFNVHSSSQAAAMSSLRVDALMWGVLIFLLSRTVHYRQLEPFFLRTSRAAVIAVNALLLYLLVAMPAQFPLLPTTMGMVAIVTAALVFLASFDSGYVTPFPPLTRLFVWVGERSYGIYIIHMVAYRLTFEGWARYATVRGVPMGVADTAPMVATAAVLLLVLAEFNYRVIERPLRERGQRLAEARLQQFANLIVTATDTRPAPAPAGKTID